MRRVVAVTLVVGLALLVPSPAVAGEPVWGKDLVEGSDFPLPFGLSAVWFDQDQEYTVDRLTLGVPGLPPIPASALRIENSIEETNLKLDAWLFPWLNVFGIAGQLDGETTVDFATIAPLLGLPFTTLDIAYDGDVYGAGAVLAVGSASSFASLTAIVTETSLSGDFDSEVSAAVVTPRVGLHNRRGAVYIGAMYLDAQEKHRGTIVLPLIPNAPPIPVPFDIELSQNDDWNWLVGGTLGFAEHWTLQVEAGFEGRDHVDVEIGYRF